MKPSCISGLLLSAGLLFTLPSCLKKDTAVVLPPAGPATKAAVSMGEDYRTQLFYDFETNQVVRTSEVESWDLAFEASANGYHVFMNGGKSIYTYNTHLTEFSADCTLPSGFSAWEFDSPSGLPDSTAIGNWWNIQSSQGNNNVYLVKLADNDIRKIQLLSVTPEKYLFYYGRQHDAVPHIFEIPKDSNYNFIYFSFQNEGKLAQPEPPKNTWDVVFTRYRYIYYYLNNFPYEVNGVLLNPYATMAAVDSTTPFYELSLTRAMELSYVNNRDVIGGFGWKEYDFNTSRYQVDPRMNYVVRNRNGQWYKLHFLDFYNQSGQKGCPSFEFSQIR